MGDDYIKKNLIGQSWKLAFRLQDDGWILRSDIVWSKTTLMPDSVKDRPIRAHDFLIWESS
jgi:site-specific DNA-methyltransferase (adenine-specific)